MTAITQQSAARAAALTSAVLVLLGNEDARLDVGVVRSTVEQAMRENADVTAEEVADILREAEEDAQVMCIGCGKHLPEEEATRIPGEPGTYSGEPWFCAECEKRAGRA